MFADRQACKIRSALSRASAARPPGALRTTQWTSSPGLSSSKAEESPAAAYFDVVGMSSQAEHTAQPGQTHFQTSHGACPLAHNSSSSCLSRKVSIAFQKPR